MNDLCVGGKAIRSACGTVIEPCAYSDQHVTLGNCHVGSVSAVHAKHAEKLRMNAGEPAEPHERIGHRKRERLCKCKELVRGFRRDYASTRIKHGFFRC